MSYKIENGKVYKIEEVNTTEIEKEVKQVVNYIKQCDEQEKPYLTAIASKEKEKAAYNEKIDKEIANYQAVVDQTEKKKNEAKAQLLEKKEIISQLYPEYSSFLGF